MKALSSRRSEWLLRQARIRLRVEARLAGLAARAGRRHSARIRCSVIPVPEALVAEKPEQRQQILNVIRKVEHCLRNSRQRVKLDFSYVTKIFPGGMLLLLGSISQLTDKYPGRISGRCPPRSLAAQLLNHFGLAPKLKINAALSVPTHHSVTAWNFLTGTLADGGPVRELLDRYRDGTNAAIPEGLFAVLTEALTNVRQHAYKDLPEVDPAWRRWWLFARFDEPKPGVDGILYIAIYDAGEGIPATMRNKLKAGEKFVDLIDKTGRLLSLSDGRDLDKHLMFEAVEHRRSQTGQAHRGNGLPEMRDFAASDEGGRFYIVSGHAQYSYAKGYPHGQVNCHKQEMPGTLILWALPLKIKEL